MEYQELPTLQTNVLIDSDRNNKRNFNSYPQQNSPLDVLFPTQLEDAKIAKARKTIGTTNTAFTDDQVKSMMTDFQFLIDTWMDEYEKNIFNGMTLENLLKGM